MPVNGIRLFRLFGITVSLHWSWLFVAAYQLSGQTDRYDAQAYRVAEYLALFGIVLLHEFGHALACRSVGGRADRILLWPLGGVAYVQPPPRPGAVLWSIAAGPLVNVALLAPLGYFWLHPLGGDVGHLLFRVALINAALLVFNLLPIYPLDGGQILQSLLWFVLGRARSLSVAAAIGMVGAAGLGVLALYGHEFWLGLIAAFAATQCWAGWQAAKRLRRADGAGRGGFDVVLPTRPAFACPACGTHPPVGPYWACPACGVGVDKFASPFGCPACGHADAVVPCPRCGVRPPYAAWRVQMAAARG